MEVTKATYQNRYHFPELRFNGFGDKWIETRLKDLTSLITKGTTPQSFSNDGINFVKIEGLEGIKINKEKCLYIDNETHNKELRRSILESKDLLFAIAGATIGKVAIVTEDILPANTNQALAIIRLHDTKNLEFILQILQSRIMKKYIKESISVGAQPNLNLEQMGNFAFHLPNFPEQQKIASFLSAVDEKIQQLNRKKELLEQYKKGLMQQLFSGKLRFKDVNGKAFPKWEEKTYDEIYSFLSTNSLSRENLNYESGVVRNIHYGDIHTKFNSSFQVAEEEVPYINAQVDISKIKEENYAKEGDLVIADASEDYDDIGKSIELVNLNREKVVAGLHTFLARPDKHQMYIGFGGHLVKADYVRAQIKKIAQGTKVLSLSTGRLAQVKLQIPCLEEQKKITEYLSNIDTKITIIGNQINQTQTFKRGLLQQMFV
jgi:type I restriction enzyme, S subunit